jgi:chorismate-pyruvate lyase
MSRQCQYPCGKSRFLLSSFKADVQASHTELATQTSDSLTAIFALTQCKVNTTSINRKHIEMERTERRLEKEITKCKSYNDESS